MWGSTNIRDNQWHHIVWVYDKQEVYDKKYMLMGNLMASQTHILQIQITEQIEDAMVS